MTDQYMLMFSLGPVQPFIAQARKARDLWLGSFLLSKLMEAALVSFEGQGQLIFPTYPYVHENIPDIPNKYVAIFSDAEQARDAARKSEEAIYTRWRQICEAVLEGVFPGKKPATTLSDLSTWDRQTNPETLFEIYWVVVKGNENNYAAWFKNTLKAFDARKRLRDFRHLSNLHTLQEPYHETGEKSTISGSREALHGNDASRAGVRAFWRELAKFREHDLNQEGEERLDAIDTVKRFAFYSPIIREKVRNDVEKDEEGRLLISYPSTSTIATAPYVEQLLRLLASQPSWTGINGWRGITKEYHSLASMPTHTLPYLQKIAGAHENLLKRDGDCYFQDTFTVHRLDKTYHILPDKQKEPAKHERAVARLADNGARAVRDLLNATKELNITPPTPYYAMIQMDGDRMGILLSNVKDSKEHTKISEALSTFSREEVPRIVEQQYPARLIYAGGDDVFALAPLARDNLQAEQPDEILSVFDLVDLLQQTYCQKVGEAASELAQYVSASVGIVIAHHYTSLSYVRRISKAAEDLAKKGYGRNALVVSVMRRSGEQTTVGCHWRYAELPDNFLQPLVLFKQFFAFFKQDILSPKCVYTLLEEAPALIGMSDKLSKQERRPNYANDARVSEIKRVLQRQSDTKNLAPGQEIDFLQLAQNIAALADAMDDDKDEHGKLRVPKEERVLELHANRARRGLTEVLGWLQVMAFLARKGQE